MTTKGSSRKGTRRRKAAATDEPCDEGEAIAPIADEEAVKLDPTEHGFLKKIPRIQTPIQLEEVPLSRRREKGESTWGQQLASRENRLTWISFSAVIVILFLSIALVNMISDDDEGEGSKVMVEVIEEKFDPNSPLAIFEENPYRARLDCIRVFRAFTAASKVTQARATMRIQPETDALLAQHWQPWPSPPALDNPDEIESGYDENEGRAYLWLRGKNTDGTAFLAFFVRENEAFLLDWEATMEIGDTSLATLVRHPTEHPVTMRVILTPDPYYLPSLLESDYESFKITCLRDDTTAWGYVKRGTPEHQRISHLQEQDHLWLSPQKDIRVTLRLKKTGGVSLHPLFFITEMLHKDWVIP